MTAKDCNGRKITKCSECDDIEVLHLVYPKTEEYICMKLDIWVNPINVDSTIHPDCPLEDWSD